MVTMGPVLRARQLTPRSEILNLLENTAVLLTVRPSDTEPGFCVTFAR